MISCARTKRLGKSDDRGAGKGDQADALPAGRHADMRALAHRLPPELARHIEEMMSECGLLVHHATVHRWAIKILPVLYAVFRRSNRPIGKSWRMDETCVKVAGQWQYQYRVVDRDGHTIDFLLRSKRDTAAALRFLERAIALHGEPQVITIDKSGANTAPINDYTTEHDAQIALRQSKYLDNIVEQDHRAIKRIVRPMLGFKCRGARECALPRYRNDAHDPQGAVELPERRYLVRSKSVLLARLLSGDQMRGFAEAQRLIAK